MNLLRLLPLALLLVTAGVWAEGPEAPDRSLSLSLAEAVALGTSNNLGIQADRVLLDQKKWEDAMSWNLFMPKVTTSASLIRSLKPDSDLAVAGDPALSMPRNTAQGSLGVTWTLNLAMFPAVSLTKKEYERGTLSLDLARKRLNRDIRKAYYALVLARESVKILGDARDQAQARLTQAKALAAVGGGSGYTVLAEEVTAAGYELPLAEQEDTYQAVQAQIRTLLGLKPEVSVDPADPLADPAAGADPLAGAPAGIDGRLDLACLKTGLSSLQAKVDAGAAALVPSLFLSATADPTFQGEITKAGQYHGSLGDQWKMATGTLVVGVTVPLDALVPGSSQMTELDRAKSALAAGKLRYAYAAEAARTEVDTIVKELKRMGLRRDQGRKSIELAENLFQQTQKAFDSGAKTRLDLQDAVNRVNGARFDDLRDRYNYCSRLADLDYALGGGDLAAGFDQL